MDVYGMSCLVILILVHAQRGNADFGLHKEKSLLKDWIDHCVTEICQHKMNANNQTENFHRIWYKRIQFNTKLSQHSKRLQFNIKLSQHIWLKINEIFSFFCLNQNNSSAHGSFYKKLHISCPTGLNDHIIIFDGNK